MSLTRAEVAVAGALLSAGVVALAVVGLRPPAPTVDAVPARLDLNAASPDALALLPDVGAATAAALVRGRPYRSVEDARPVLGDALFARVSPYLTVSAGPR